MSDHLCEACGDPQSADQATICTGCQMRLTRKLQYIPALMRELNTTVVKLARTAPPTGPGGTLEVDPVKMPFNVGAARARDYLHDVLQSWAKLVSEERTTPALMIDRQGQRVVVQIPTPLTCKDNPTQISGWLLQYTDWLRRYPAAADVLAEITEAIAQVERFIDIQPRLQFVGPCQATYDDPDGVHLKVCTSDLYAREDADEVTCRECRTVHDIGRRRSENLRAAHDVVTDPETIARALRANGVHVTVDRIYKWRERGQLAPAQLNQKTGRFQYRFGDVHDLWAKMQKPPAPKGTK